MYILDSEEGPQDACTVPVGRRGISQAYRLSSAQVEAMLPMGPAEIFHLYSPQR